MAIEPNYRMRMDRFVEGMIPDARPRTICTRTVETVGGIGFGKPVYQGTAESQCRKPFAGGSFLGFTQLDPTLYAVTADLYPQYEDAAVLQKGPMVVKVAGTVAPGNPVYIVVATSAISADSAGGELIPGAKFESAATAGGLAKIFIG